MALTKPEEVAEILARHLRESNAIRHELGIEDAVDTISDDSGEDSPKNVIAFSTTEGVDVFLKVEFS